MNDPGRWFAGKVRRNLVDMHIEAWDEQFLSQFDPQAYVANLRTARVQVAMVYANSHVGYCYWTTTKGEMHPCLKGRNVLREIFDACHVHGIDAVLYYSLVFDNWAYEHDQSWRIRDAAGRSSREPIPAILGEESGLAAASRYGVCCPNAPGYRQYTRDQIEDFCTHLEFEGVFFDMTFWPSLCYCDACSDRFHREVGGRLPDVVDWKDPQWLAFQRKRADWLLEFGSMATETVKKHKPDVSVNHQFSTAQAPWIHGVSERHRELCDYLGGDFYNDFAHQIFFCKLFGSISPALPFEFHTSRCTDLRDHTTTKSLDELRTMNALTFVNQGATLFIDAIDPEGTMNPDVYQLFSRVFEDTIPLESYIGGWPLLDVAVYYSMDSNMDRFSKAAKVSPNINVSLPHLEAAKQAAATLSRHHIPYGVIGRCCLDHLDRYKVLVLPNVQVICPEEAQVIREYVQAGGSLYASGSSVTEALGDVLGVTPIGLFDETVAYLSPTELGTQLMPGVSQRYPLMLSRQLMKAHASESAMIAAQVTLPYGDPRDRTRFASIHSNPPGRPTEFPAVVVRTHGKGRVLWTAGPLESSTRSMHRNVFFAMIRSLIRGPLSFEISAPPAVEASAYHQPEFKRILIALVNVQELLPAIPVRDIGIRLSLGHRRATRINLLPHGTELAFHMVENAVEFTLHQLEVLSMASVEYSESA